MDYVKQRPVFAGSFSRKSTQALTQLPQLLRHSIVLGFGRDVLHRTVGKVTSAEGLDSLLESTMQGGLRSLNGVNEEQLDDGLPEQLGKRAGIAAYLGFDST